MNSETIREFLDRGLAASAAGRTEEALEQFCHAAALPEADGAVWQLLAAEHAAAGQIEQAEAAFAEAVLRSPDRPMARYQLGLLQLTTGRAAMALLSWQPLLQRLPEDELHAYVLGYVALVQNRLEDAMVHFRAGLAMPQNNEALRSDIHKTLAATQAQLEKNAPAAMADDDVEATLSAEQLFFMANYTSGRSH